MNTHYPAPQPGKVVILLTGRYAGKKAVIVKNYDDGQGGRAYGHAIVVGLQKEPRKVCARCLIHTRTYISRHLACAMTHTDTACSNHQLRLAYQQPHCCCAAIASRSTKRTPIPSQVTKKTNQKTQARRSSLKVRAAAECTTNTVYVLKQCTKNGVYM